MKKFNYKAEEYTYYDPTEIRQILKKIDKKVLSNKKIKYYQIPCAFDIETTNINYNGKAIGFMYVWQFIIDGYLIIGRTWEEFVKMIDDLATQLYLSKKRRLICLVHNLSYEFQFMRKWFKWAKVFSIETRKPLYAVNEFGIEFRCSYLLTGTNLNALGKRVGVKKLVGDLDYKKVRTSKSHLTVQELAYMCNDVIILDKFARELIKEEINIARTPLTKTGYVRRDCKRACYGMGHKTRQYYTYKSIMEGLTIEPWEYDLLKQAFQGGFTHASAFFADTVVENVESKDFTSSYPTRIVGNLFPMSKGRPYHFIDKETFELDMKRYNIIFEVRFINLKDKIHFENYLSWSKCRGVKNDVRNNGRIVSADELITTITEVDFDIIRRCYKWDDYEVGKAIYYKRGYLPKNFVEEVLRYYVGKTVLKGQTSIDGSIEKEYQALKSNLNSCYGMMVTDPCQKLVLYNDDWVGDKEPVLDKAINKYNKNPNRFTFYLWGIYVTAFSRRELWKGISELGSDYIYSDTDSVKFINADKHEKWFEDYNKAIIKQLETALDYHGLSHDLIRPKNIKGKECPLGIWDFDGRYSRFKSLGAKRYLYESKKNFSIKYNNASNYHITVSGLNKQKAVPFIYNLKGDIFDNFTLNLSVPEAFSGRTVITYTDSEVSGEVIDWQGKKGEFYEKTCSNISETTYSMKDDTTYIKYLLGVREVWATDGKEVINVKRK